MGRVSGSIHIHKIDVGFVNKDAICRRWKVSSYRFYYAQANFYNFYEDLTSVYDILSNIVFSFLSGTNIIKLGLGKMLQYV